jgi:membrane-associated protease RseP (regulator of RpoE activity)
MLLGIEAVTKRRLKPGLEQKIHMIGIVLLLGLMVLITINDIKRLLG